MDDSELEREWRPNNPLLFTMGIIPTIPAALMLLDMGKGAEGAGMWAGNIGIWFILLVITHIALLAFHQSLGAFLIGGILGPFLAFGVVGQGVFSDNSTMWSLMGLAVCAVTTMAGLAIPASYRVQLFSNQLVVRFLISRRRMPLENIEDVEDNIVGSILFHHGGKRVRVWLIVGAHEAAETITIASRRAREAVAGNSTKRFPPSERGQFCTECGAPMSAESKFCGECGVAV